MIAYHTEAPNGEIIPYSNGFRNKQDAEKWLNNFKAKIKHFENKHKSNFSFLNKDFQLLEVKKLYKYKDKTHYLPYHHFLNENK